MAASRLQLLSKTLIKPSSQTPHHLRDYKVSFMDQLVTPQYIPIALFYPNQSRNNNQFSTTDDRHYQTSSDFLKKSLSEVLSSYYPFAGRLVDSTRVDCNDMGAVFSEARIRCSMSELLKQPYSCVQDTVFPACEPWSYPYKEDSLVIAQLSHFDCGGKALCVCVSHRIADAFTEFKFVSNWAALARQYSPGSDTTRKPLTSPPHLIGASTMPPKEDPSPEVFYDLKIEEHISTRRFTFPSSKIDLLKRKVASESQVKNPTRYEVLTALLNRCAAISSPSFNPFTLFSPVNYRKMITAPPLPENSVGNFVGMIVFVPDEADLKLSTLASKLRKEKEKCQQKYKSIETRKLASAAIEDKAMFPPGVELRLTSSVCDLKYYDIDFGWGRPVYAGLLAFRTKYTFLLMDDQMGDGVDAMVTLDEQVMQKFETNQELLEFASFNPGF